MERSGRLCSVLVQLCAWPGGYKKAIATAPATMTPVTLPRITALCRVEAPSGSKLQVPTCGSNERADGRWGVVWRACPVIACVDAVSPDKRAVCSGVAGVPDGLMEWEPWATAGCEYTGRGADLARGRE